MLATAINFRDAGLAWNSNFSRFELVLQSSEAERTVLPLTPGVHLAVLAAQE